MSKRRIQKPKNLFICESESDSSNSETDTKENFLRHQDSFCDLSRNDIQHDNKESKTGTQNKLQKDLEKEKEKEKDLEKEREKDKEKEKEKEKEKVKEKEKEKTNKNISLLLRQNPIIKKEVINEFQINIDNEEVAIDDISSGCDSFISGSANVDNINYNGMCLSNNSTNNKRQQSKEKEFQEMKNEKTYDTMGANNKEISIDYDDVNKITYPGYNSKGCYVTSEQKEEEGYINIGEDSESGVNIGKQYLNGIQHTYYSRRKLYYANLIESKCGNHSSELVKGQKQNKSYVKLFQKLNTIDTRIKKIEILMNKILKFSMKKQLLNKFSTKILLENKFQAIKTHNEIQNNILLNEKPYTNIGDCYSFLWNNKQYQKNKILFMAIMFRNIYKENKRAFEGYKYYQKNKKKWKKKFFKQMKKQKLYNPMGINIKRFFNNKNMENKKLYPEYDDVDFDVTYETEKERIQIKEIPFGIIQDIQPMIIQKKERINERFLDLTRLVTDPLQEFKKYENTDSWTDSEKRIYWENFRIYRKEFGKIQKSLPNKSMKQIINFYYLNKNSVQYRKSIQESRMIKKRSRKRLINEGNLLNKPKNISTKQFINNKVDRDLQKNKSKNSINKKRDNITVNNRDDGGFLDTKVMKTKQKDTINIAISRENNNNLFDFQNSSNLINRKSFIGNFFSSVDKKGEGEKNVFNNKLYNQLQIFNSKNVIDDKKKYENNKEKINTKTKKTQFFEIFKQNEIIQEINKEHKDEYEDNNNVY
ncbi:nuclear receptor co-repressor related ncor [Anaeramoeba flamelloides]|uniref:Nuclear receptor co-repressor related ncor n=1 Tax=Anaeramoeba flamelloides TaxID=1746091 RepID=A0ABQ8Z043_9EUKA|nr:nuclear receptor co-repressor related ncor [Anaeramoeba flamelloides]